MESMIFEELNLKVIKWASERNLLGNDSGKQLLKTMSELGELSDAHLKSDKEGIIDGLGDVFVTLIIYCAQNGLHPTECLESAWNEIKDRSGKTINGTFIKDEVTDSLKEKDSHNPELWTFHPDEKESYKLIYMENGEIKNESFEDFEKRKQLFSSIQTGQSNPIK